MAQPKRIQLPVTDSVINTLDDWRVFVAADKEKSNKNYVPKMIKILDKPEKYDSLFLVKIVDSLVAFKSYKSIPFIFDLLCRYIDFNRKNNLTKMAHTLQKYGGYQALNKHFLNSEFSDTLDPNTFRASVFLKIREKHYQQFYASRYWVKTPKPIKEPEPPKWVKEELQKRNYCSKAFVIDSTCFDKINSFHQLLFLDTNRLDNVNLAIQAIINEPDFDINKQRILIEKLAKINSPSVKQLFYFFMVAPLLAVDDMSNFSSFAFILQRQPLALIVDSLLLNNQLRDFRSSNAYSKKVLSALKSNISTCYACHFKTSEEMHIEAMKAYDTRHIDKQIEKIINRNSALKDFGGYLKYHIALDSIIKQVLRIENITDAYYDYCQTKLLLYPGWETLGIVYWPEEKLAVQKCYPIQIGNQNGRMKHYKRRFFKKVGLPTDQDFLVFYPEKIYYKSGFVDEERKRCEEMNYKH